MLNRIVLALLCLMPGLGLAQANELSYSELEARLSRLEAQLDATDGVQQVGYSQTNDGGHMTTCGGSRACDCNSCNCGRCDSYYADVQFNFFRAHYVETFSGGGTKLSEEYELSPRLILGYENSFGQGFRARYWHYGHHLHNLSVPGEGIRTEMDIVDLEITKRLCGRRTDVTLGGGVRFGHFEVFENSPIPVEEDILGLTFAADVESLLCCDGCSYWSAVYGGRMAILGGDLDFDGSAVLHDDFWKVFELYAGVEYGCTYCGYDVYSRMVFEVQNWQLESFNVDSIGFVGPGFHLGMAF